MNLDLHFSNAINQTHIKNKLNKYKTSDQPNNKEELKNENDELKDQQKEESKDNNNDEKVDQMDDNVNQLNVNKMHQQKLETTLSNIINVPIIQHMYREFNFNSKYILDPLSVIIKLAILSYKPVGTKISINNNVIYINEVGIFQSLVRYIFNNNKNDMEYLFNPIEIACNSFINKYKYINKIFEKAIIGLNKLSETYKDYNIIRYTLLLYINIIDNHVKNNNTNLFVKDKNSELYTNNIIMELNSIWNQDNIKFILDNFEYIDKDSSNKSIKCIEEFMSNIDNIVISKFVSN